MRFFEPSKLDYVLILDESPNLYEDHFRLVVQRASRLVNLPAHNIHLFNEASSALLDLFHKEFSEYKSDQNIKSSTPRLIYQNLGILAKLNFNLSDAQYFGLLALSMVDEAILIENYMTPKLNQYDWGMEDEVLLCLTSATEATCFGEALEPLKSSFSSSIESEVKRRAQRGANKRYEPIRKIKNNFLRVFDKNAQKKSKAQVARNYFRSLSEDEKKILCPTLIEANAVRTLTEHLREYRKKISPK